MAADHTIAGESAPRRPSGDRAAAARRPNCCDFSANTTARAFGAGRDDSYHPRHMLALPRIALALLLFAACSGDPTKAAVRPAPPPRPVQLVTTKMEPLQRSVQVHGTLLALDELELGFQLAGRLASLSVDLGDEITKDAVLATLDRRDFELGRAQAAAELEQSRAQLGLEPTPGEELDLGAVAAVREAEAVLADARQNRDRTHDLVQQSLRSSAELNAANAALAVAQSRVQRARDQARTWIAELEVRRQQLAIADKRLLDTEIRAPWAGRVARRHAAVGQYLPAGSAVLTLLRTDPLRLRLQVAEREAAQVRLGQRVTFTVDGSHEAFSGTVNRLGSQIARGNRTMLVEAAVENAAGRLLPGGFCRALIVLAEDEPAVVVASSAVASFAGVDRLFSVEGGKAKEHLVVLGRRVGERVEIVSGIAAGTQVIDAPTDLTRGAPVLVGGN